MDEECTKVKYSRKSVAQKQLKIMVSNGVQICTAYVYPCPLCDYEYFHITSGLSEYEKQDKYKAAIKYADPKKSVRYN